ncbi:MAG: RluA family pseudouridine synthase [Prevotella sp.]|nr:RluA family pseudouridine synthase [Prevotella sp.]
MFHPITAPIAPAPSQLNSPFSYEPHPLCRQAAAMVQAHLVTEPLLAQEVAKGKMLGVLVCRDSNGSLGFLAAYSGQLCGRADWPWFVPAVFDYLQPDGYFRQEEARISAMNHRIAALENSKELLDLTDALARTKADAEAQTEAYRQMMAASKARRHALRQQATPEQQADMTRQSQFQKAELRRMKKQWTAKLQLLHDRLAPLQEAIRLLQHERQNSSEALQQWLFDHFVMLNAKGEKLTLTQIFAATPQRVPPSGAGECCAPKLLQYAFLHQLQPLAIAEFWQGESPKTEVRHPGHYYPACRGKCKPILEWMLKSIPLSVLREDAPSSHGNDLEVVYSDPHILVVNKPSGLLSVPGLTGEESVESLLCKDYGRVYMVHRLDQDTSGLLVVALTPDVYHNLQRQFLAREIYKRYIALLDGNLPAGATGIITLPLSPDIADRPRQMVDYEHGKEAVTHFEVLSMEVTHYEVLPTEDCCSRVALTPHTGRTHQLRVHCAHRDGLGRPIVGDPLYGSRHPLQRLCLHAETLSFRHPVSGQPLTFRSPAPF